MLGRSCEPFNAIILPSFLQSSKPFRFDCQNSNFLVKDLWLFLNIFGRMSDSLSHLGEWQGAHSPYIVGLLTLCISIPLRQVKQEVTFVSKCWCRVRVFAHFFYFSEEHADFLVVSSTRQLSFYSLWQKKQIRFSARQTLLKTYILLNFCRVFQRIGCCYPYRRQSILFIFRGVISPLLVYYYYFF